MAGISFGGLASGLDTNGIVQQLIALESRPITLLSQQRSVLQGRVSAFKDLNTRLSALENAAFDLTKISNIISRKATSSKQDTLVATANSDATPGSFQVEVLRLATSTKVKTGTGAGQGNTLGGIADATDFTGETYDQINTNHRLREDLAEGTFFVNGQQVLVANTDTLGNILSKISTATGGAVTGSLVTDPAKGGLVLQLSSGSAISVTNGTSNFLAAFNLDTASYAAGTLTSTDAVNAVRAELKLDGSAGDTNLALGVTSGTLVINGTNIDYNTATDSINSIVARINESAAGVRATFSNIGGARVTLTSKNNGPLAVSISDSGSLAAALGLTAADSQTIGQSAQLRVDGGAIQSFNKNTGITAAGLDGVLLDLRDDDPGNPVSITIEASASVASDKIKNFVDQFNAVVKRIDELTAYNAETRERGILLSDSSISNVKNRLYEMVFGRVGGLSGTNSQGALTELGFNTGAIGSNVGTTIQLQLDSIKLQQALEADPNRVAQLLGATDTTTGEKGVMEKLKDYLDGLSNSTGIFNQRSKVLETQIDTIGDRIDVLNKRLAVKQKLLESQFTNLELTLSRLQSQQTSLNRLFSLTSSQSQF